MSEPEDERLRAARIKAALAFFGPQQATMREALECAGFELEYSERYQQRVLVLRCPGKHGTLCVVYRCAMSARSCSLWLLGLPEEWEVSEGAYERARGLLLSGPEGVSRMLAVRAEAAEARIAELEAEQ